MTNSSFAETLSKFFNNYLTIQRNVSSNTIRSYKTTFKLLINYLHIYKSISIKQLSFKCITRENILDFLNYLEESNVSVNTRNQRLAAIKSFCRYCLYEDISNIDNVQKILSLPIKKENKKNMDYLTKEEYQEFINYIVTTTRKGIRDYTLITLLYDSAIRVAELTNLKICDIKLDDNPSITVYGKGRKYRNIPVTDNTKETLINYINLYKLNSFSYLFSGNNNEKASSKMVTHIIEKYSKKININKRIHPHTFRHTRAMHLLEAGVPLVYIRDILGHESVTTTEIYAKVNIEIKRNALNNILKQDEIVKPIWQEDKSILEELLNL